MRYAAADVAINWLGGPKSGTQRRKITSPGRVPQARPVSVRTSAPVPAPVASPPIRRLGLLAAILCALAAPALADQPQSNLVKRGEYLARAGDCFSCHTQPGGTPLAGGRQVQTPYGTIAAPNITPDRDTGIGKWSNEDFYRLMHDGIDRERQYVYPVMPFDHYTKVTREDVQAIKAYLFSLQPVHAPRPPSHLAFPFDIRSSLIAWRTLFFKPGTFEPDRHRSELWNRGAYLVEGLGHCGACHTPRNLLSGSETGKSLGGGEIKGQGWFAPNITSDVREGIGGWSEHDLVEYLKTGVAPGRSVAAGPMTETIHSSLQYLTNDDLRAIAAYLKEAPGKQLYSEKRSTWAAGETGYLTYCASCHQLDGRGIAGGVPALAGNGVVTAGGPQDVIRTILGGMPASGQYGPMPGFAKVLSSVQIAEIANYIRTSWGNKAPPTEDSSMVADLTRQTNTMLAGTAGCEPVAPPLAQAIDSKGIEQDLRNTDAANMLEQINVILPKLTSGGSHPAGSPAQADLVNGLTAAYCPVVMADGSLPAEQRLWQLQHFASLVYTQLASHDKAGQGGARQTGMAEGQH